MKSIRSIDFLKLQKALPAEIRRQAKLAYEQFRRDPFYPSLQFKRVNQKHPFFSVRVGLYYRAVGIREQDDLIVWFWIGTHAEYDRLIDHLA